MAQSYSWDHQTTLRESPSTAANPSVLVITLVNEQFYPVHIKVTEFCAPLLSKLQSVLRTFLKDNAILTSFVISI